MASQSELLWLRNMRTAFYPCCASDFVEPQLILREYVDQIVFCDIKSRYRREWKAQYRDDDNLPLAEFLVGDARNAIRNIIQPMSLKIDVLFYRRDGMYEGGSGVAIWSDAELPSVLRRFPDRGGLIVSDGSNDLDRTYREITEKGYVSKFGWILRIHPDQPFKDKNRLTLISAEREI